MSEFRNTVRNLETEYEKGSMDFLRRAITMGGSGVIEQDEEHGQAQFLESDVLPRQIAMSRDQAADLPRVLRLWGFDLGDDVPGDALFRYAKLPPGWKKRAHVASATKSDIIDEHGRERLRVFFKASSHDRKAHMAAANRYRVDVYGQRGCGHVRDCGVAIHEIPILGDDIDSKSAAHDEGEAWLNEHFPLWMDPTAYWDDEER